MRQQGYRFSLETLPSEASHDAEAGQSSAASIALPLS
jgi:hypothetical protein